MTDNDSHILCRLVARYHARMAQLRARVTHKGEKR